MKRLILTSIISMVCLPLFAQNDMDAIRYTNKKFGSTAKSVSIAGAVGALGADISSASVNPAALAQYKKGEFSFSLGFVNAKNTSTYLGNTVSDNTFNMNIPNVGLVIANKTAIKKNERGWKNYSLAINMARVADFNKVVNFSGVNNHTSLMDYFAERANGLSKSQVRATNEEFDNNEYTSKATMAWEAYLFDSVGNKQYAANASPIFHAIYQKGVMQQSGGMNEYNFSLAGNYSDVVYLGATLCYTSVNFSETRTHAETNDPLNTAASAFDHFTYSEHLETSGGGFSGRLGIVVKAHDFLRIGAAIQTPQLLNLDDDYDFGLKSRLRNGNEYDLKSKQGQYAYSLLTPAKYTLSATGIIGKKGFISADIENIDYSAMRLRSTDGSNAMEIANDDIRGKYTDAFNYRLGGELVIDEFRIRGGYAHYASPFNESKNGNLKSKYITGGLGIKDKNWALDLGLVHMVGDDIFQPYVLNDNTRQQAVANNTFIGNSIQITFTSRF